jgi:3-methyladenine DNA glycosylase AlkC
VISRVDDIKPLLARSRAEPESAFPQLQKLAASDAWQTREVAARALVEIGKRHPEAVLRIASQWAQKSDAYLRRAAIEGLRGIVKLDPKAVQPVLEVLREDPDLYVKKSVANVLRNASSKHPDFVLSLCRRWARSRSSDTRWILKDGLRKLRVSQSREVEAILRSMNHSA